MTLRAIQTLQTVDLIAAEDTRHSAILCQQFQITTPLISYHQHNHQQRLPHLLAHLQSGKTLALITDAGMPGIADPGEDLVQVCLEYGIPVIPIPGVSACLTALIASGLSTAQFVFEGFLPSQASARQAQIERWRQEPRTVIFYEAPHRLLKTLPILIEILGEARSVVVARELTKKYEEFWRGSLGEALAHFQTHPVRGELTLLLAGVVPAPPDCSPEAVIAAVQALQSTGLSLSQASRDIAHRYQLPRQQVYQWMLHPPTH
ncbi:MAG: 16S rRNA (cytidine(1402)-2'-O)-methyltransferase [Synechococcales cyanobacterium]